MHDFILSPLSLTELETLVFNQVRKALKEAAVPADDPVRDELLTIEAAATLLSVTVPTVYGYVHQRAIPCMKRRGRLYFSKVELLAWIKSSRRSTTDEIKINAINSLVR
ncbi:MAG: helix-turn-helix domain-containing protein [Bacteroidota bacterium]